MISNHVQRVLAAVAGLLIFTLNELRLFNNAVRSPDDLHAHAAWLRVFGGGAEVYLSTLDLAVRWGLAGLVVAASMWALARSLEAEPADDLQRN